MELLDVCWLEIKGQIESTRLSHGKKYTVHLIYKLNPQVVALKQPFYQEATIDAKGETKQIEVNLDSENLQAYPGGKGWLQIKLGEFSNTGSGTVHAKLLGSEGLYWKRGLIVAGMEFKEDGVEPPLAGLSSVSKRKFTCCFGSPRTTN